MLLDAFFLDLNSFVDLYEGKGVKTAATRQSEFGWKADVFFTLFSPLRGE